MDTFDLQRELNRLLSPSPALTVDGDFGRASEATARRLLAAYPEAGRWGRDRVRLAAMQEVCRRAGHDPGPIDGLNGPQTRAALDAWAAVAAGENPNWRDALPPPAPSPAVANSWPRQANARQAFGEPGARLITVTLPYPMRLSWEPATVVRRMSIHRDVAASAVRVLERAAAHYGEAGLKELGLDLFGGCYNNRAMRGGTALSMHAYGVALDFDPDRNQLRWGRDRARLARPDAAPWWDMWEAEGWVSLGRAANYDWMHVQAARL